MHPQLQSLRRQLGLSLMEADTSPYTRKFEDKDKAFFVTHRKYLESVLKQLDKDSTKYSQCVEELKALDQAEANLDTANKQLKEAAESKKEKEKEDDKDEKDDSEKDEKSDDEDSDDDDKSDSEKTVDNKDDEESEEEDSKEDEEKDKKDLKESDEQFESALDVAKRIMATASFLDWLPPGTREDTKFAELKTLGDQSLPDGDGLTKFNGSGYTELKIPDGTPKDEFVEDEEKTSCEEELEKVTESVDDKKAKRIETLQKHIEYHKDNLGRLSKNGQTDSRKDHEAAIKRYEDELKTLTESVSGDNFDKKIDFPKDIKKAIDDRIKELHKAIELDDSKGYNDQSVKQNAVDALTQILQNHDGTLDGLKKNQIFIGTLMTPITSLLPQQIYSWLGTADNKIVKEADEAKNNVIYFAVADFKSSDGDVDTRIVTDSHPSVEELWRDLYKGEAARNGQLTGRNVKVMYRRGVNQGQGMEWSKPALFAEFTFDPKRTEPMPQEHKTITSTVT